MIPYNEITDKLKDPEFIGWLCKLSQDWNIHNKEFFEVDYNTCFQYFAIKISFISLIFQAWIGWNRKYNNQEKDICITILSDYIKLDSRNSLIAWGRNHKNYEPDKPLVPELQALIDALWKVWELEKLK